MKRPTVQMHEPSPEELIRVAGLLREARSWTLFSHKKADGDTLGSASALFEAGLLAGKRVTWHGPDESIPPAYRFLAHSESCVPCGDTFDFNDPEELYIFLDCANDGRSVEGLEAGAGGIRVLNIDHHEDNTRFGTVNCVAPRSSSTSELLFRILKAGDWPMSRSLAQSIYVGIWTDSGGFSFSNTSPRTHLLAAELMELGVEPDIVDDELNQTRTPEGMMLWSRALSHLHVFGEEKMFALAWLSREDFDASGAHPSDTEGLSGSLMKIRGVRMAAFLTEQEPEKVKASFRSRGGVFPAAEAARFFGGGGHPRAAGATLAMPLSQALEEVQKFFEERHAEWTSAH